MTTFYRCLPKFEYSEPNSIEEALTILNKNSDEQYKVYAGGTDVLLKLKQRVIKIPKCLINLKQIPNLNYIKNNEKNELCIGATTTISDVANSPLVKKQHFILANAASSIAGIQVRNRGTIAGNICNAVPSADSAPALLTLNAKLLCVSNKGERIVPIEEFFVGPNENILEQNELLKEIQIPNVEDNMKGNYIKLSPRSKMEIAVVGVAALTSLKNNKFKEVRIALGAVAPTPIRAMKAESILKGEPVNEELIKKAAEMAARESKPIDDHRASAEYRKMMVEVLVKRAINTTLKK